MGASLTLSILIPSAQEPRILEMLMETEHLFPAAQIIISNDRERRGKGWAIREAMSECDGDLVCLIDGDLDISPLEIRNLLQYIDDFDIVVGRKNLSGSFKRKIITVCCRIFTGVTFGLWLDTQTGVKLFRREFINEWKNDSFIYDIEVLYRANKMGARIKQVPVKVNIRKEMPVRSIIKFLLDAVKLRVSL